MSTTSRSPGPTGRPRSTSGKGSSGCPSSSSSPTSTTRRRAISTSIPGDGRLITDLHQRGARGRSHPHADGPRLRAPPRVRALAGDLPAGGGATRRARDLAQRRQGPRLHGLDLLRGPARPADRARVLSLRAAARPHPRRRAARGAQDQGRSAATTTSPRSTSPTPSRRSRSDRERRSRTTGRRRTPTARESGAPSPRRSAW